MQFADAKLAITLLLSLPLAALGASWLTWRYRVRMLALMKGGVAPAGAAGPVSRRAAPERVAGAVTAAANRRALLRLTALLAGVSVLIALTQSLISLPLYYDTRPTPLRTLTVTVVHAWPLVFAAGLVWRWRPWRLLGALLAYLALAVATVMLASSGSQSWAGVTLWVGGQTAMPAVVLFAVSASARIRAAAPYLLPLALPLVGSSILGLDLAQHLLEGPPSALLAEAVALLGAIPALLLFILAPWAIALWPGIALGRWLARAYRRRLFSDLLYLFGAWWLIVLLQFALTGLGATGWPALLVLLAWLWIPLVVYLARPRHPARVPTLLVLRVFQRDREVARLFDAVVHRWRMSANTVLIAGSDLLAETMDVDDMFAFLGGRLHERFIADARAVPRFLADFELRPDPDGRYRLNECHCTDQSWQAALKGLVDCADVVLMDLRSFNAANAGCRFELEALAAARSRLKVVVLFDARTDRALAAAASAHAPPDRFRWVDAQRFDAALARRILDTLFESAAGDAPVGAPAD